MTPIRLPLLTEKSLCGVRGAQIALHQELLEDLERQYVEPCCRRGCSHCCYHPVAISILEGAILYQELREEGLWTLALERQVEKVAKLVTGMPVETWLLAEIACPLLTEDGDCRAYKARPLVCRTTYSLNRPELCQPRQFGSNTPLVPRLDKLQKLQDLEKRVFRGKGHYRVLPLPLALLLGAGVISGEIDLEASDEAVVSKYLEMYST